MRAGFTLSGCGGFATPGRALHLNPDRLLLLAPSIPAVAIPHPPRAVPLASARQGHIPKGLGMIGYLLKPVLGDNETVAHLRAETIG